MFVQREIEFIMPDDNGCGVYRISFGKKYYIGCSNNIARRLMEHQKHINYIMQMEVLLAMGCYREMKKHLVSYSKIKVAKCMILEKCEEKNLIHLEGMYLLAASKDNNCLNRSFPSGDKRVKRIESFMFKDYKKYIKNARSKQQIKSGY